MITPNQILVAARALSSSEGSLTESLTTLFVAGRLDSASVAEWKAIATGIGGTSIGEVSALDEVDETVELATISEDSIGLRLRIKVEKTQTEFTPKLFTALGLTSFLVQPDLVSSAKCIKVAETFDPFRTESCAVEHWTEPVDEVGVTSSTEPTNPRRIVRDLIGGRVPNTILPFLLSGQAPPSSDVYTAWQRIASEQLLLSLVSEVWTDNGTEHISLNGPRTRRLISESASPLDDAAFSALTEAARWVYASGRDVEVRHILFTYEAAREWPEEISWGSGFATRAPRALDAARSSFHAHIRETSKDTLKSLADLRKALSEEVAKVVTQTRELLSTMWRDFFLAATALLGRIALLAADKHAANEAAVQVLMLGAAAFLIFSLYLTLRSNSKFMAIAEAARVEWRSKLYGFLPAEDLRTLADVPLAQAEDAYRSVKNLVIAAYAVVLVVLLAGAVAPSASLDLANAIAAKSASSPAAMALTSKSPSQPASAATARKASSP
jgi:hypothetical protein